MYFLSQRPLNTVGRAPGFGIIVHVAAHSHQDFNNALIKFSEVAHVTGVVIMSVKVDFEKVVNN